MPEGPEITFLVNHIICSCVGEKLKSIKINSGRYIKHGPPNNYENFLLDLPLKCINVKKKGKVIFIFFQKNWCIISKLGMTGWWFIDNNYPDWRDIKLKSIIFNFTSFDLNFSDFRNFGTFIFTNDTEIINKEYNKIAYDILDPRLEFNKIKENIVDYTNKHPDYILEDVIINQKAILSGIGNYLKSEILYDAKISPLRKLRNITLNEWKTIFNSATKIANKMLDILAEGMNSPDYAEKYINEMKIYRKNIDPKGNKIIKHKTKTNRTTFYVKQLQK